MIIAICAMSMGCGEIGVISMRQIKEVGSDAPCTCWNCAAILGYHQPAVIEDDENEL
jgi:hypothetical protein